MRISVFFFALILTSTLLLSGCQPKMKTEPPPEQTPAPVTHQAVQSTPFTATFEITTNGTRRVFSDSKYHNQSPDIYLEKENPQVIVVKQAGLTWADFFATLPFSLTPDCLVTGTKQTFCTNETHALFFTINDQEVPNALEQEIQPNDRLSVTYRRR